MMDIWGRKPLFSFTLLLSGIRYHLKGQSIETIEEETVHSSPLRYYIYIFKGTVSKEIS
jgi:hypothetical protein